MGPGMGQVLVKQMFSFSKTLLSYSSKICVLLYFLVCALKSMCVYVWEYEKWGTEIWKYTESVHTYRPTVQNFKRYV